MRSLILFLMLTGVGWGQTHKPLKCPIGTIRTFGSKGYQCTYLPTVPKGFDSCVGDSFCLKGGWDVCGIDIDGLKHTIRPGYCPLEDPEKERKWEAGPMEACTPGYPGTHGCREWAIIDAHKGEK